MRVLVTWGSKRGGTEGLARMVADALGREGMDSVLAPARSVSDASAFDAVIIGGALYANRWYRVASSFVKRHSDQLRSVPVWFFSSGPLDDSAQRNEIPPTKHLLAAVRLARRQARAETAAMLSGALLATWIVLEVIFIRQVHWLQALYLVLGFAILELASRGHRFDRTQASAPRSASPRA